MNPTPKRGRGRPRTEFKIDGDVGIAEALGGEQERNADAFVAVLERVLRRQIHRGAVTQATVPEHLISNDKRKATT